MEFFYAVVTGPELVRSGDEVILPKLQHTWVAVYAEMLLHVAYNYAGLGNWRDLSSDEIEGFYDFIRPTIKSLTKPSPND